MHEDVDGSTPQLVLMQNAVSSQLSIRKPALSDDTSPAAATMRPVK